MKQMAKLIYLVTISLDGYVADKNGNFDWTVPDEEEFCFIKELVSPVGTYLNGRRMYEVTSVWQIPKRAWSNLSRLRRFAG